MYLFENRIIQSTSYWIIHMSASAQKWNSLFLGQQQFCCLTLSFNVSQRSCILLSFHWSFPPFGQTKEEANHTHTCKMPIEFNVQRRRCWGDPEVLSADPGEYLNLRRAHTLTFSCTYPTMYWKTSLGYWYLMLWYWVEKPRALNTSTILRERFSPEIPSGWSSVFWDKWFDEKQAEVVPKMFSFLAPNLLSVFIFFWKSEIHRRIEQRLYMVKWVHFLNALDICPFAMMIVSETMRVHMRFKVQLTTKQTCWKVPAKITSLKENIFCQCWKGRNVLRSLGLHLLLPWHSDCQAQNNTCQMKVFFYILQPFASC